MKGVAISQTSQWILTVKNDESAWSIKSVENENWVLIDLSESLGANGISCEHNINILSAGKCWYGECASKQWLINISSRHRATLAFI